MYSSDLIKPLEDYRKSLTEYVKTLQRNAGDYMLDVFAEFRGFKLETIKDAGIFYINNPAEMLVPEYIDELSSFGVIAKNNRPIYAERYVIPIYDCNGYVMAMVGYKFGVNEKYMYANTKYFNRGDALYGLQDIDESIREGTVIVVEGLMDRLRILELGFKNCIATCGADKSWERMLMFHNIGRCLFIPDRDRAGEMTNKHWVCGTMARLLLPKPFKDIDEFARTSEETSEACRNIIKESLVYMNSGMVKGSKEQIDLADVFDVCPDE